MGRESNGRWRLRFGAALSAGVCLAAASAATAQENVTDATFGFAGMAAPAADIDFGNDTSDWANDGECDDNRFEGPGMAAPPTSPDHVGKDASDCRAAMAAGQLTYVADARFTGVYDGVDFGDNRGDYVFDRECDDPRFIGAGMTGTPLLDGDIRADADDCYKAYVTGTVALKDAPPALPEPFYGVYDGVDFGDNSGEWALDDECDDPRFSGVGMTDTALLDADIRADADDCYRAYIKGALTYTGDGR